MKYFLFMNNHFIKDFYHDIECYMALKYWTKRFPDTSFTVLDDKGILYYY